MEKKKKKKRGVKGTWAVYREMLEREQSLLHFRAAMDDLETLDNDRHPPN